MANNVYVVVGQGNQYKWIVGIHTEEWSAKAHANAANAYMESAWKKFKGDFNGYASHVESCPWDPTGLVIYCQITYDVLEAPLVCHMDEFLEWRDEKMKTRRGEVTMEVADPRSETKTNGMWFGKVVKEKKPKKRTRK